MFGALGGFLALGPALSSSPSTSLGITATRTSLPVLGNILLPLLFVTAKSTAAAAASSTTDEPVFRYVNTTWGMLKGELVFAGGASHLPPVAQFLGVPYGVAPTGQHRFRMAVSAAKWTHITKEARKLAAVCVQSGMPELHETKAFKSMSAQRFDVLHRALPHLKRQSEDCLYLNIYVPERADTLEEGAATGTIESDGEDGKSALLPVVVIVHGDSFGWGAGSLYSGAVLAAHQRLVVVTLNYRLGVFGFLAHCESEEASCAGGNAGISDILSALKMLHGLLPAFGGDKDAITLLGWGSGAALVHLLMASPLTAPGSSRLFRRAVLLDGAATAPWATVNNPQPYFAQLVHELGCDSRPPNVTIRLVADEVDRWVRCIQEHSAANVTRAARRITTPSFLSSFAPTVDGQLIANRPRVSFSSSLGSLYREIDLLVAVTSNPAHHMLANDHLRHGMDGEARDAVLRTLVRNLFDFHRNEILAAIKQEYTDWDNPNQPPQEHPKSLRDAVLAALGDALYTTPALEALRLHAPTELEGGKSASTYMLLFAHETRAWLAEQPGSGIRGSLAGDLVPYVLGEPLLDATQKEESLWTGFSADDRAVARVLMHYVANFVRSGHPTKKTAADGSPSDHNPKELTERFAELNWPQFGPATREAYLEISDRPRIRHFYRNRHYYFWRQLVPQLHGDSREQMGDVAAEHHHLPDHFRHDSYYGHVRTFSSWANVPFPPPPPPPSPIPPNLRQLPTLKTPTAGAGSVSEAPPPQVQQSGASVTTAAHYSTTLSYMIVIGVLALIINICGCLGLQRKCSENRRRKQKQSQQQQQQQQQMQYSTYIRQKAPSMPIMMSGNAAAALAADGGVAGGGYSTASPRKVRGNLMNNDALALLAGSSTSLSSPKHRSHHYHYHRSTSTMPTYRHAGVLIEPPALIQRSVGEGGSQPALFEHVITALFGH